MVPRSWKRVAREFSIHSNILDEIKWAILKWEALDSGVSTFAMLKDTYQLL